MELLVQKYLGNTVFSAPCVFADMDRPGANTSRSCVDPELDLPIRRKRDQYGWGIRQS